MSIKYLYKKIVSSMFVPTSGAGGPSAPLPPRRWCLVTDLLQTAGPELMLLAQTASTLYLVGLVWMVQRVHYPLFAQVGPSRFAAYERAHVDRITPVVAPAMLIEAGSALALVWFPVAGVPTLLAWLGLVLVLLIWGATFALQVPRHANLRSGFDATAHRRLVGSNWIRTVLWSLRGVVVLAMVLAVMVPGRE